MPLAEAQKISTILRHPRSRVRLNPNWVAPTLHMTSPHGEYRVSIAKNRVTRQMWTRISHSNPTKGSDSYFLVQLTARCRPEDIATTPAQLTKEITSLFGAVAGDCWYVVDDFNPQEENGDLRWNWYLLMTHEELNAQAPQQAQAA